MSPYRDLEFGRDYDHGQVSMQKQRPLSRVFIALSNLLREVEALEEANSIKECEVMEC